MSRPEYITEKILNKWGIESDCPIMEGFKKQFGEHAASITAGICRSHIYHLPKRGVHIRKVVEYLKEKGKKEEIHWMCAHWHGASMEKGRCAGYTPTECYGLLCPHNIDGQFDNWLHRIDKLYPQAIDLSYHNQCTQCRELFWTEDAQKTICPQCQDLTYICTQCEKETGLWVTNGMGGYYEICRDCQDLNEALLGSFKNWAEYKGSPSNDPETYGAGKCPLCVLFGGAGSKKCILSCPLKDQDHLCCKEYLDTTKSRPALILGRIKREIEARPACREMAIQRGLLPPPAIRIDKISSAISRFFKLYYCGGEAKMVTIEVEVPIPVKLDDECHECGRPQGKVFKPCCSRCNTRGEFYYKDGEDKREIAKAGGWTRPGKRGPDMGPWRCPDCQPPTCGECDRPIKYTFERMDETDEKWDIRLGCVDCAHKKSHINCHPDDASLGCLYPGVSLYKVYIKTFSVDSTGRCTKFEWRAGTMGAHRANNLRDSEKRGCLKCVYADSTHFKTDTWPCVGTAVKRPPAFSPDGSCTQCNTTKVWTIYPSEETLPERDKRIGCPGCDNGNKAGNIYSCVDAAWENNTPNVNPDTGKCLNFKEKHVHIRIKCADCKTPGHLEPDGTNDHGWTEIWASKWLCPDCQPQPWDDGWWNYRFEVLGCNTCKHHKYCDTGKPSDAQAQEGEYLVGVYGWCSLDNEWNCSFGKSRSGELTDGRCAYWEGKRIEISNGGAHLRLSGEMGRKGGAPQPYLYIAWGQNNIPIWPTTSKINSIIKALQEFVAPPNKDGAK